MNSIAQFYQQEDQEDVERFKNSHIILEQTDNLGALYLGDIIAAESALYLKQNNITCILTIAKTRLLLPKHLEIQTMTIAVDDSPIVNLKKSFEECFNFIHQNRSAGKNVLVHCMAGVSRSATIVISYVMGLNKMGFDEAYKIVKDKRQLANPNGGFLRQLKDYETELKKKSNIANVAQA